MKTERGERGFKKTSVKDLFEGGVRPLHTKEKKVLGFSFFSFLF
jgi:hypothetical protein